MKFAVLLALLALVWWIFKRGLPHTAEHDVVQPVDERAWRLLYGETPG